MKKLYLLLTFFALSCMSSIGQVIYSEGFEDFDVWPTSWSRDQWDNDNFNWVGMTDQYGAMFGTNYAVSFSFINGQTLTPDNWFTSPAIQINTPSSLSFWVRSSNYPGEHYAVYIANSDVYPHLENFEVLVPERVAAAQWENVSVSIPAAYWGSSVRIAFRHFNSVGIGELGLDNVAVTMALGAINTMGVSDVTPVSATVTGYINPGMMAGYTPDQEIQYGFYWSTSPNPGFDPFDSNLDMVYFSDHLYAPMSFDIPITMLQPNTTYYVRSFYEVYNDTLEMGNELSFHTPVCESAEDRYETACDEYQGITESGTYTLTYTNQFGCDSVVTLHLTIVDDFVIGTYPVQNVTSNSASLGGYLDFSCDNVYPQLGVCYSTSPNPTVDDTYMLAPMSPGSTVPASSFTLTAEGLAANTTYYVRAFGITSEDTVYGQEETFTTYGYAALNGTVVSIATGLPIAGAEILISAAELQNEGGMQYWYRGESIKETVTDSNGVFFVDSIVMSSSITKVFVDLWAEGYQSRAYLSNLNTGINSNSYTLVLEPCYEVPYMVHWEELNNGSYQLSWWAMGYAPGDSIDPKYNYQLTYNVYENGSLIAEGLTNQWYMLPSFNANSCYQVRGICPNGVLSDTSECATIKPVPPVVVTNNTTEITGFTAVLNGEITFDGNSEIYSRGFYTNTIPTLDSGNVHYYYVDSESYTFSTMVSNLEPETTYYVWAYAMNEAGETYSNMTSFTTTRACYAPADFQASDVMASSAFLTWSDGNEPSSAYYELSYKAFGADSWTVVNLTNPFCMLSGLQQNTSYMARVRTFCEEGLASPYYSLSFKTSCVSGGPLVTIGDNSTYGTDIFPTNICYNYSYNQQIYLASEIGGAREISEIDLQCFNQTTRVRDMEVYLGHTDKQYFSNNADWIPYTELQLVYSGEITFNDTHEGYWLPIVLDSSFAYNGSDNLVIVFRDNSGWWKCDGQRFYTHPSSGSRTLYAYRDGSAYSMQSPGSGTMSSYRDNLRIPGVCLTGGCDQSNVVVVSKTDHSAQLAIAAGNFVEAVELEYKAVNDNEFTPIAVQGDSCNLTGLMGSTDYVLRIRSLCTEDTTDWKMVYFSTPVARYDRLYVTTTGTGNGSSWEQATNNLSAALSLAAIIREDYDFSPEIWVAEGTYYGDGTSVSAFTMEEGVNVYGGFVGNETSLSQRDMVAHPTILDGQNSQRVLYQPQYFATSTTWDGFTLQHGYAVSNNNVYANGGGAYLRGYAVLRHCNIINNTANCGGGLFIESEYSSYPYTLVDSCTIANNTSTSYAGGVYALYAQIRYSSITGNTSSGNGAGVFKDNSSLSHCVITGNTSNGSYQGGGVYNYYGGDAYPISNCLIAQNTAGNAGGVYAYNGVYMYNTTVAGNTAMYNYGGVYASFGQMTNSVVWGNHSNSTTDYNNIIATFHNCAIEGKANTEGVINLSGDNIGSDANAHYPVFVSPGAGDYRLRFGSVLINAGVMTENMPLTDVAGESRVYGDTVDVGCYEFHNEEYCVYPVNLLVSEVMNSSALLTWENGNMEEPAYYELSYRLAGDAEWTVLAEQLHDRYKMMSGLQAGATYMVRIRTFCTSGQTSDYTQEVAFTTPSMSSCAFDAEDHAFVQGTSPETVGGGFLPSNFYYDYSLAQQIFQASELGGGGLVDTLAFQFFYSTTQSRNLDIYLGHVTKTYFSTNSDWVPIDDMVLVYSGNVEFQNTGDNYWFNIGLQNVFEYNGYDNLVLMVVDRTNEWTSNGSKFYTHIAPVGNSSLYVYRDGSYLDPASTSEFTGSLSDYRNNLRLHGQCVNEDCSRSNLAVVDVTANSAKLVFVPSANATAVELQYAVAGSDNFETLPVQDNEYQLTGLRYNTAYEARIRSLCSGDEQSSWKTVHFTTQTVDLDRLYVTTTGTGDGSSWENATNDLAWALNTAAIIRETFGTDVEVWMAEGTYYGDSTSKSAFTMVDGVNVFGGFAGTETELSQRDFNAHPTILDGQNNQRVLCQDANFDAQTIWDGFTLQHGYVTSNNNNGDGGAAYLRTNTVLRNCNIVNNTAYSDGGGVYIVAENYRPALLDHCIISHNTAIEDNGGGVYTSFGILRYCIVSYNRSSNENGGGVYVYNASNNNGFGYALSNCLIANNSAAYYGGGVYNRSANTVIANSTIVNNNNTYSNYQGAGVYCYSSTSMINSILWGNEMSSGISNLDGSYSCQYCAMEEVVTGTGNISLMASNDESAYFSPHFVNPSLVAGYTDNTDNVDWHLSDASIGVNRGNNSLVATADSLDLDGNVRIQVQTVDMGCYESPYNGITLPEYGAVVYVKQGGSGAMDGTSWANASASIPEALSIAAMNNADVWVAEGIYYGDSVSNNAFSIMEGVDVYGGFAGDEAENYNLSLRDFDAHTTILDGQNNQRVLYQPNGFSNQHTTWDGFTIQNGRTEYENNNGQGGGAYLKGGVTLNHCIVTNNYSYNGGGGIYCITDNNDSTYLLNSSITHNTARYDYGGGAYFSSNVVADNCEFAYNTAQSSGGGVYNYSSAIRNCMISHNTASNGAGVYNYYGTISSSVISYNTASSYGGGLYLNSSNSNTVSVSNCLVANNTSSHSGAGVYSNSNNTVRSSSIVNNKITGTSSSDQGAGAHSSYNTLTVTNSIIWGNKKNGETSGIAGTHVANYVASDDACTGEHNVALMSSAEAVFSPKFVNPSVEAGAEDTTSNVDWHLAQGSPCVNRGDNGIAAAHDLAGAARIQQDTIDLGCYESPYNSVALPVYDEIIYVAEGGAGTKTGENWANAMGSLQDAVQIASIYNATVWVAAGTYHGDGISENAFVMKPGVNVYGGFAGNETPDYDLSQRDFTANATILDGQFSQRVLMQPAHFTANTAVVWDGFDIRNGRVNGDGAGAYLRAYSTLRNCKVQYNTIASSTYSYDYRYGAGVYAYGYNSGQRANISHCKISYNGFENVYYGYAGGIYTQYANVDHTEISHNTATYYGGGAYAASYSKYSNCLIFANTTPNIGGGMYLSSSSYIYLYNCDIVNNTSTSSNTNCGGGIYANNNSPVLTNCIVWGNKRGYVVNNFNRTTMSNVTYCAVEEGYNGTGNIALASSNDGVDNTMYYVRFNDPQNEDYQLHPTSNCVNIGNASIELDALDFYGNPRVIGNMVDMGCSEVQDESNCNSVINLTASNITTVSAQLNWQPTGEETQWVVVYGMVNSNETTSMTIDDNPSCLLEGLQNNRQYLAKVRAVCDESSMSIFSIPVSFQTTCDSSALDTLPNFSGMLPAENSIIYNSSVTFSWAAMAHATSYDFYLWKTTESEPATPTHAGLVQPNYVCTVPGYSPGVSYNWKVVAWNECISKTSEVMTIQANWNPDLHVSAITTSTPVSTQPMTVTWTVTNDGQGNTPPAAEWYDHIWLTPVDGIGDGFWYNVSEVKLAMVPSLNGLNAGMSYTNSVEVTIPEDYVGSYYLFVLTDQPNVRDINYAPTGGQYAPDPYMPSADGNPYPYLSGTVFHFYNNGVVEQNEADNFFYKVITILPPPSPDLVVSSVVHGGDAASGHETSVTWTVANQGEAAAMGSWVDVVYFSSDTLLDTQSDFRVGRFVHDGPLAINESYQRTEQFTVPVDYNGDYYFIVVTDNNNTVYEGLQEINNITFSSPMHVTLSWFTDLVVSDMTMTNTVDANGDYYFEYTVINNGASPTNVSSWYDAIYISQETILNVNNGILLGKVYHSGVVNALDMENPENSSYHQRYSVHIPENISGNWNLFLLIDVDEQVFEYNAEFNNSSVYHPALTVQNPDLTVTNVELPDVIDPNEPVRIQWTVRNEGPGNLVNRSFKDKFFVNGNQIYVATVNRVSIPAGESIVRSATVRIPCVNTGTAELTIVTDAEGLVMETVETNNSLTENLQISAPDFLMREVTPVVDNYATNGYLWSGTSAELTYKVANMGQVAVSHESVKDKIYLSTSSNSYQASDLIYTNVHAVDLAVGDSATYTCSVTIPNGISGMYYYHVVCNANDTICEGVNVSSNVNVSDAVEVMLSPSPDLVITNVTAPSQVYIGAGIELFYTVKNQGETAVNSMVTQKFYYSTSPYTFSNTHLLGSVNDYLHLDVNDSVSNVVHLTMPINVNQAAYFIHAVADANDQIYEHNHEDNNTTVSNSFNALTYELDLQLTQIEGPDVMQWGETATYTLHIHNNSALPTLSSYWNDVIYLSSDEVLHSTDPLLATVRRNTVLAAGADYEVEVQVTIPFGTPATAYLIAVTDFNNNNPDVNINNNLLVKQLTVNTVPTPDLAVSEVVVLDDVFAGQPARLAYKVTNVSETSISLQTWNDRLFLSYNDTYESSDLQLLNKNRSEMTLAQNEFYRDTLNFTVPLPNNGHLYLLMMANAGNNPFEAVQTNNTVAVPVDVVLPLPGDLVVTEVSCESSVVSGQTLHANWMVKNIGDNTLMGSGLRSLVYISTDTEFDANDRLLGSVTTTSVSLGIDATLQQSLASRVSGLAPGNYYLIVKTDVTNAFNEVSDDNNTGHTLYPFEVTIRPLPFNENVYDTLINNEVSDYMLNVGDNQNQTVRIHVASEDSLLGAVNMIYATYNAMGDNLNYSYSTIGQFQANSELYIPSTQQGYYGVNIYGSTPTNLPQNTIVRADILPFELRAVNDDHGGNTGVVTVELTGSRFRPDMRVTMRHGNEVIAADTVIYVSYYQVFAQFDLIGHTPGTYDVSAVNFCEGEAVLANGFTIEEGQPSGLSYNLLFPSSPRPNRNVVMMLEFGNIGNVDLHNQVLEITSLGGVPIALTPDGISLHQTVLQVPLSIEGEPAGLLRPGSYGTLNIYGYTSGALMFTIKPVQE